LYFGPLASSLASSSLDIPLLYSRKPLSTDTVRRANTVGNLSNGADHGISVCRSSPVHPKKPCHCVPVVREVASSRLMAQNEDLAIVVINPLPDIGLHFAAVEEALRKFFVERNIHITEIQPCRGQSNHIVLS